MEKEYALVLSKQLENGMDEEKLVAGLVGHLKAEGRMKLLPGIVRELKNLHARTSALLPTIEIASESEKAAALSAAKAEGIASPEVRVNPSLIRGWRLRSKDTLVDRSAKQALVDLYQRITH